MPIVERGQRFHGFTPDGERVLKWAHTILDRAFRDLMELTSIVPQYFLDVIGPMSDVRGVPLSEPLVQHSVGLVGIDRDPVSPLVLAAFECARIVDPPGLNASRPGITACT